MTKKSVALKVVLPIVAVASIATFLKLCYNYKYKPCKVSIDYLDNLFN